MAQAEGNTSTAQAADKTTNTTTTASSSVSGAAAAAADSFVGYGVAEKQRGVFALDKDVFWFATQSKDRFRWNLLNPFPMFRQVCAVGRCMTCQDQGVGVESMPLRHTSQYNHTASLRATAGHVIGHVCQASTAADHASVQQHIVARMTVNQCDWLYQVLYQVLS